MTGIHHHKEYLLSSGFPSEFLSFCPILIYPGCLLNQEKQKGIMVVFMIWHFFLLDIGYGYSQHMVLQCACISCLLPNLWPAMQIADNIQLMEHHIVD